MASSLGEFLHEGKRIVIQSLMGSQSRNTEKLYKVGMKLKRGEKIERNMRNACLLFKKASKAGHQKATSEFAERYLLGRRSKMDLVMAAKLGCTRVALDLSKLKKKVTRERTSCICGRQLF